MSEDKQKTVRTMPKTRCPLQILPLLINRGRLSGALTIPGALSQWNCKWPVAWSECCNERQFGKAQNSR